MLRDHSAFSYVTDSSLFLYQQHSHVLEAAPQQRGGLAAPLPLLP